jgi:HK97 family phage prohead protease
VRKTTHVTADDVEALDFVLSDSTPDRHGDVVMPNFRLENFSRNPVCLFSHRPDFIVGKWSRLRVEKGALRGRLQLAPKGISQRLDEVIALVEHNLLRAVSIGFRPIESRPRYQEGGVVFECSELVEVSLVAIPSNSNALRVVKSLNISDTMKRLIFTDRGRGAGAGKSHANMTPLSERVAKIGAREQTLRAELQRLVRLQQAEITKADDAVQWLAFLESPEAVKVSDVLAGERVAALEVIRKAELSGKALDLLIWDKRAELRRVEGQAKSLREARRLLRK